MSPFVMLEPLRVTNPFRASLRCDDTTSVLPCSRGARRELQSSSPDFKLDKVSWRAESSQESSRCRVSSTCCPRVEAESDSNGGHSIVDMMPKQYWRRIPMA